METPNCQLLPNYALLVTSSPEKPLKVPIRSQFDWRLIFLWDWSLRTLFVGSRTTAGCVWVLLLLRLARLQGGLSPGQAPCVTPARMLLLCCYCGDPYHRSTCHKQASFCSFPKTYLAWNETPSASHQSWRGLQTCFPSALIDVHVAERLTEYRLEM